MQVEFTFKHMESSETLMDYARERIQRISKFEIKPMDIHFLLSSGKDEYFVEVHVIEGRRKFKAAAVSEDFCRSIEMVVNKLFRQMSKDKKRLKSHKSPDLSTHGKLALLNEQLEIDFSRLRKTGVS